jgi:DNA polymerase IV
MRKIVHLDMDAFYASVEQRDTPALKGRPVVVGGSPESRGVVAAASYEARAYGVRSAMPTARALRLCPGLIVLRPDFHHYRAVSEQVLQILRSCTPLVEPLSLDEAYLDVTENLWGEPYASTAARRLKRLIRDETGLTASAGVAPNKFLAKIASGWRKPDGLTVISPDRVESFLQQLPVDALWGVGPVTAAKLKKAGIERLVDVRAADPGKLHQAVGGMADWLHQLAAGHDPREVCPNRPTRSVSEESTYAEDLVDPEAMRNEVEGMARRVAAGLERKSLVARTISIKVRYSDFTTVTRSHTAAPATRDPARIAERAVELLRRTEVGRRPVRLLGAGAHNLLDAAQGACRACDTGLPLAIQPSPQS